jgi:hypothetical protein
MRATFLLSWAFEHGLTAFQDVVKSVELTPAKNRHLQALRLDVT